MSGRIVVMGSGELAPGLVGTHRAGLEAADAERVTLLDTPYGFQENADELTGRIREFFDTSLVTPTTVASLRTADAPPAERARALAEVRRARYVFAGPGSPTYAVGVWHEAGMGEALREVVVAGGTVTFASAAALTLGSHTLPVYELYKVGQAPHWQAGLDVLSVAGLSVPVVPHWDNAEGGTHDTSHCYVGRRRFEVLMSELTTGALGVDEHTAATIDLDGGIVSATGRGAVTLWTPDGEESIPAGSSRALSEVREALGGGAAPVPPSESRSAETAGLETAIAARDIDAVLGSLLALEEVAATTGDRAALQDALVRLSDVAGEGLVDPAERLRGYVRLVLDARDRARDARDFGLADALRDGLVALGVEIRDTPDGTEWSLR